MCQTLVYFQFMRESARQNKVNIRFVFDDFFYQLQLLVQSAKEMKSEETVLLMKKIVPEFKSKNSEFERLDH